jgi:Uma2 family endonuclease
VRLYDKHKSDKANKDIYTVVQPDLCVICDLEKLDDKGCLGAPDLVVEILPKGNSTKERLCCMNKFYSADLTFSKSFSK